MNQMLQNASHRDLLQAQLTYFFKVIPFCNKAMLTFVALDFIIIHDIQLLIVLNV